ncbi:hypothetical protein SRHO_G00026410 [Serrasalmus rhombeus]
MEKNDTLKQTHDKSRPGVSAGESAVIYSHINRDSRAYFTRVVTLKLKLFSFVEFGFQLVFSLHCIGFRRARLSLLRC